MIAIKKTTALKPLCDIDHNRRGIRPALAEKHAEKLEYSTEQFVRLSFKCLVDRMANVLHGLKVPSGELVKLEFIGNQRGRLKINLIFTSSPEGYHLLNGRFDKFAEGFSTEINNLKDYCDTLKDFVAPFWPGVY